MWSLPGLHVQTAPRQTLLVKPKTDAKAILYRMFEGPRDCLHAAGDPRSYGVGNLPSRLNQQSHYILYRDGTCPMVTITLVRSPAWRSCGSKSYRTKMEQYTYRLSSGSMRN